jgi:hypothetical protein
MKLLEKETLKIEKVDLGGGDFVHVRQMTGRERDRFERSLLLEVEDRKGNVTYKRALEDFRAKLAVNTLCDEKGDNLMEPTDADVLSQHMSAARLERIVDKAQELNKISEEDKEAMVKNSEGGQTDVSNSGSAAISDSPTPTNG